MSIRPRAFRTRRALRRSWPVHLPLRAQSMRRRQRCMPCSTRCLLPRESRCRDSGARLTGHEHRSLRAGAVMPFVTADEQKSAYDVIVVGSGAAGGQTAYTLCMEGARVLMLEAGRKYAAESETPMFQTPDMAPLGGVATPDKVFGFYDATVDGGWQVPGEPYVRTTEDPAGSFWWWRCRMLGGRTSHWGRISLRNGRYDFKPRSRDGLGFDWPIAYEDLASYYDKVELLIGVYGTNEGRENTPDSSPGCLLPPPAPLVSDLLLKQRAGRLGVPVIPGHRAVLTRALDHQRNAPRLHPGNPTAQKLSAEAMRSRGACLWATP